MRDENGDFSYFRPFVEGVLPLKLPQKGVFFIGGFRGRSPLKLVFKRHRG